MNDKQKSEIFSANILQYMPHTYEAIVIVSLGRDSLLEVLKLVKNEKIPVYIWLNNKTINQEIKTLFEDLEGEIYVSPYNMGPFARFVIGRELAQNGVKRIVFLDDDWMFPCGTIRSMIDSCDDKQLIGHWAYLYNNPTAPTYFDRTKSKDGEPAHYVGTGGCCLDAALLLLPDLFILQEPFRGTAEDIYLSFLAYKYGYSLKGHSTELFQSLPAENNHPPTWCNVINLRDQMLNILIDKDKFWLY